MPRAGAESTFIFHIALERDWRAAQRSGEYRISTLGRTLEQQGFIHASFDEDQVERVGALRYVSTPGPFVVLRIDAEALDAEVRAEDLDGTGELFPHIYGPLATHAVVEVLQASVADGRFTVDWLPGG